MTVPSISHPNVAETREALRRADSGIMPWTVAAAGLVALLTLTMTAGWMPLPPVFALLILASYVSTARLEGQTFHRWWVRLGLIVIIIVLNQAQPNNGDFAFGSARARNILAQVYAAEFVIQCWRRSGQPVRSRLIAIVASGLLMLSSANTFDERFIKYLAPLYMLFLGMALYTHRPRLLSRMAVVGRVVFLVLTLGVGATGYLFVDFNRGRITELGNRLLGERFNFEATGMASNPSLGETFGLRGGTQRVLRITGFVGDPHLRGMAFDRYEQGRWYPSFADRRYRPATERELNPSNVARATITEMTIEKMGGDTPLLFAPLQTATLALIEPAEMDWAPESGGPIRTRARPPFDYRVGVSSSETYQGLLANPLKAEERTRYLQLPSRFDPRVTELAKRITKGAGTDAEKVEAVIGYLIGNYSYSLRFRPGRGEPLVNFLTAEPKRPAHCEYFAAASAMLLRCVGVPTRYVTGYFAHEGDGPNITVVRQRDAHAWSEAWIAGVGWVTVEATPGDGRPDADQSPPEWWRRLLERTQDGLQIFAEFLAGLSAEQVAAIVAVILGAGGIYGFRLYRRRKMALALASFAYAPPERRLAELIVRFEAVFARRGQAFPPSLPYREHLDRLADDAGTGKRPATASLLDAARRFVALYEASRFGNRGDEPTIRTLQELVEEMERTKTPDR
ncbi:MAG: transglutaminaseTgpA domain-containing protein [Capsulimonadales bacterium]|nr:transglutaminaseTgpA domain-containing protein [Capsulimonadales bacterium]